MLDVASANTHPVAISDDKTIFHIRRAYQQDLLVNAVSRDSRDSKLQMTNNHLTN